RVAFTNLPASLQSIPVKGEGDANTTALLFLSSRRRHTRLQGDWSSDVCSSDLPARPGMRCEYCWRTRAGSVCCAPRARETATAWQARPIPPPDNRGTIFVKVIASSLRKGNIVELEGKLYVVLNAESFHPGKGTPTTQVDM